MIMDGKQIWSGLFKLVQPSFFAGNIIKGFGRGSTDLGFPTANIDVLDISIINPGIYAGIGTIEGKSYKAAVSIGWCPYYGNSNISYEVYLLDKFSESLIGKHLQCEIIYFLRNETSFGSMQELISAISKDVQLTDELIKI